MADRPPTRENRIRDYLEVFASFGTPDEIDGILRKLGRPEHVIERNAEIKAIIEERVFRRWLLTGVKEVAGWIIGVGSAVMLIYGAWAWALPTMAKWLGVIPPPGGGGG
jgi:hypothetical protein